eukprot:COSAG04_NODE_218_length_19866_cov_12.840969_3_plen_142_part_00
MGGLLRGGALAVLATVAEAQTTRHGYTYSVDADMEGFDYSAALRSIKDDIGNLTHGMATAKATFQADRDGDAASLATTGAVLRGPGTERAKFEAYHAAHTADSFNSSADGSTYATDFVLAALDDNFNGAQMIDLPVHALSS